MRTFIMLLAFLHAITVAHAKDQGDMMSTNKQKFCLGRFLVDLPKDAYKVADSSKYRWDKITVIRPVRREAFQQFILAKEKKLKEAKHEKEASLLKLINKNHDGTEVVMVFWETPRSKYGYETEAYKWADGTQFLIKGEVDDDKASSALDMLGRSLSELRARQDSAIPQGPGFCVDGGFFAGEPMVPHYERAFLHLRLKNNPDVRFEIFTDMNGEKVGEGLLARIDRKPVPEIYQEAAKNIKRIRRGGRDVGVFKGEEVLEAYPTDEGYLTHVFRWESRGEAKSLYAPTIVVKMESGQTKDFSAMPPSLTDSQAIEIFDTIVNSIRVRPVSADGNGVARDPNVTSSNTKR